MKDPLTERRAGRGTWYFASFQSTVYPIHATPRGVELAAKWPPSRLRQAQGGARRPASTWPCIARAGGVAIHCTRGGLQTHKDRDGYLGSMSWQPRSACSRSARSTRLDRSRLCQDDKPLLFTCFIESNVLDIYDAISGRYLRSVDSLGQTPTVMVTR